MSIPWWLWIYSTILLAFSIYFVYLYLSIGSYLLVEDGIYYMAIADGIRNTGSVLNFSTIPAQPVRTPQNGIVLVQLLLSGLKLDLETRLVVVVIINYLLHLTALYPLYKIAHRAGLTGTLPMAALIGLYAGTYHVYRFQLFPGNDGVFNALCLWFLWLIIDLNDKLEGKGESVRRGFKTISLVVLAVVLVHFRIQTLPVLLAALTASFVLHRYRLGLWILGLLLIAILSIGVTYAIVDNSGLYKETSNYVEKYSIVSNQFVTQSISKTSAWCNRILPRLLLADWGLPLNLLYFSFIVALGVALFQGLRNHHFTLLLLSLTCVVSLIAMILFVKPITRYVLYLFPILYLLILLRKSLRPIGYVFVALVLIFSVVKLRFIYKLPEPNHDRFWLYLHRNHMTLPTQDAMLISQEPSSTYLFLRTRAFIGKVTWDDILKHKGIFLVGDDDFLSLRLSELESMAARAGYRFSSRSLTSGFHDGKGMALLQIYDIRRHTALSQKVRPM